MPEEFVVDAVDLSSDDLIAAEHHLISIPITLLKDTPNTDRGLVLGRITTGGKLTDWDEEHIDGSQDAVAVLAQDISATDIAAADVVCRAYFHGPFKESGLDFGDAAAGDIAAEILKLEARALYVW